MVPDAQLDSFTSTPTGTGTPSKSPYMYIPTSTSTTSLAVNYVPSKFSQSILLSNPGPYWRKGRGGGKQAGLLDVPKLGGGIDAFRSGEARIGDHYDDDDVDVYRKGRKRWTKFKWVLFIANTLLTCYSLAALITCLLIWFNVFRYSQAILTVNSSELIASTIAASLGVLACVIGWAGILLNNRAFLAIYTFTLWVVFAAIVTPGYLSYKRRAFSLEAKLNNQWSRDLMTSDRLLVQNVLDCCGYYNTFVEATISATCYSRSVLPGCKTNLLDFERWVLKLFYTGAFGLVPLHVFVMVAGLLCSNHVTYRFGKGMMPKAYRLNMNTVAAIMDKYANELAELYGTEVAEDIRRRSRSRLNPGSSASMPYTATATSFSSSQQMRPHYHYLKSRHDSINSRG